VKLANRIRWDWKPWAGSPTAKHPCRAAVSNKRVQHRARAQLESSASTGVYVCLSAGRGSHVTLQRPPGWQISQILGNSDPDWFGSNRNRN